MNALALTGAVVGEPEIGKGRDGILKALLEITVDGGPAGALYFSAVCFGNPATAAAQLKPGDRIFAAGKLVTSRFGQAMSFVLNSFELLAGAK